jgi:drug/metabolite transporter (DMT)-like permease
VVQLSLRQSVTPRSLAVSLPARYRDAALFVLLAALFGGAFVAIEAGLRELPPVLFAGLRFDVAAVALLAYVALSRPRSAWLPRTRADVLGVAVAATFLVALNNGFLFVGQTTTTPAAAAVMYGLNPVLAPVFAWALLDRRLSRVEASGIAVALAGVLLIVGPSPATLADPGSVGKLLVLVAAGAVALGSVLLRRLDARMDGVALTAWAMAGGALLLHGTSLALGESPASVVGVDAVTAASVLVVGLPSTALAYAIYFGLIARLGPVRANLVAYAVPVFAALAGWVVLGAPVSVPTALGFLVVVAGFALVERDAVRAELCRIRRRRREAGSAEESDATPPSSGLDDGRASSDSTSASSGTDAASPFPCDD